MTTTLQPGRLLFAAALIALGITGLVNGDFALVWQSVPSHVPARTALAYLCAIIEVVTGIGLLSTRTLAPTCRVLFAYMILWLLLLQVPIVVHAPLDAGSWGGIGETGCMLAGAWCLFAVYGDSRTSQPATFAGGPSGIRWARWLLVIVLPMNAAEVIVAAVKAGNAVMQPWLQWLPSPMGWAILTGVGSIAACLALLFGVWPRLAAMAEAVMLAVIAIAYWGPALHTGRTATTAFVISFLVAGGVWLVADTYRNLPWFATGQPVWKLPQDGWTTKVATASMRKGFEN